MCANCGCGYATYDDIETGAPASDFTAEATEKGEVR